MNKKIKWRKFIGTSILTMLILIFCSYSYLTYDTFLTYDVDFKKEIDVPQDLVMYRIDEIKNNREDFWDNPSICYEIGSLYEVIYLFDEATKYYLRSIEKAPKTYYLPHFKLARLNMYRGKTDDAIFIINLIPNINNKKLKLEKAIFWEDMSVRYANKNKIDEALNAVEKAMIYYKTIDKKKYNDLKEEQAYLLMRKSENFVNEGNLKGAMNILEEATKMNNSAELAYRLAILNYKNDNKKAFKYFERTQSINPSIINYDIYYNLINELIKEASDANNYADEKFYTQKLNNLKKYVNNTFISNDEFILEDLNSTLISHFIRRKKEIIINFDIYNNTPYSYRELYALAEVKIKDKTFQKIISVKNSKNIILPYSSVKNTKMNIDISKAEGKEIKAIGKIYLYKNLNFNRIEIGTFEL